MSASRFSFIRKTLAGASLAAAAALSPVAAQAADSMTIGTVVWAGYGPFYVADKLDLYDQFGLDVELQFFNDPALLPSAMAGGAVDGAMLTYDQVVGAVAKGLKHDGSPTKVQIKVAKWLPKSPGTCLRLMSKSEAGKKFLSTVAV